MPLLVPNLAAPHKVAYIPFGSSATPAGTAVAASSVYRMFVTDSPCEILQIQLIRQTGAVGTVTYQAGSLPATTATGALTALSATTIADTATVGPISLAIESDANDATKGPIVNAGIVIGFTTNGGTVTTSVLQGVLIRYRGV